MENSDSDYKAAIARNQFNPGAAMTTGDTPVEIMLDILFSMVKAFAEGVPLCRPAVAPWEEAAPELEKCTAAAG